MSWQLSLNTQQQQSQSLGGSQMEISLTQKACGLSLGSQHLAGSGML